MTPDGAAPRRAPGHRWWHRGLVLLALGAVLVGCASGETPPGGVLEWRELTIDLPADWVEVDRTATSLMVADGPGSTEEGVRGDQQVATQFTVDPDASLDAWRQFVADEEGTVEHEGETTVGGVPARLLQYTFTTGGVPMRERIVVVPSRDLVLLQQPTPMSGETGGPDWFTQHADEFDALLEGVTFGAPEGYLEDE